MWYMVLKRRLDRIGKGYHGKDEHDVRSYPSSSNCNFTHLSSKIRRPVMDVRKRRRKPGKAGPKDKTGKVRVNSKQNILPGIHIHRPSRSRAEPYNFLWLL